MYRLTQDWRYISLHTPTYQTNASELNIASQCQTGRFQSPCGLRRRSTAALFLGSRVRKQHGCLYLVCCVRRGLCDGLITRYRGVPIKCVSTCSIKCNNNPLHLHWDRQNEDGLKNVKEVSYMELIDSQIWTTVVCQMGLSCNKEAVRRQTARAEQNIIEENRNTKSDRAVHSHLFITARLFN